MRPDPSDRPAPAWPGSLLMVGCGNMAGAMLAGWLAARLEPQRFAIVDRKLAAAPQGATLVRDLGQMQARRFDAVLLGIKPQALHDVAPDIAPFVDGGTLVLSMLAGIRLATLRTLFPAARGLVRLMPNLAAAIGKSPVGLVADDVSALDRARVSALVVPLGSPEWLADEDLLDAFTALAGCGLAFVYRYIDALAAAGAGLGLDRAQAERLALAMTEGAALLAARSPDPPGALARKVASRGGMTQAGLDVLDADAALATLASTALRAAADRGTALAAMSED